MRRVLSLILKGSNKRTSQVFADTTISRPCVTVDGGLGLNVYVCESVNLYGARCFVEQSILGGGGGGGGSSVGRARDS